MQPFEVLARDLQPAPMGRWGTPPGHPAGVPRSSGEQDSRPAGRLRTRVRSACRGSSTSPRRHRRTFSRRSLIMAASPSFDIVSKVDRQEVDNAFHQTEKELATRFDFRGTGTGVAKSGEQGVTITSETEERAAAALEVFKEKLVKRNISLKSLEAGEPRQSGKTYKIDCTVVE